MTTTAVREPNLVPVVETRGNPLAGTGTLTRLILRRDRIRLPAWLLGITLLLLQLERLVAELAATEEQRQDMGRFMEGGLGAVFGPGYGRDDITPDRYVAGVYGLIFFVLAALMSLMLVARHTRADEQSGRAELVRSSTVGRHASLTAALVVATGANVLLALMLGGVMSANGYDAGDGLLFGAGVGAVGLVFAGITALTAQITEYSRAATGIAGAALGSSWAIRAAGDMLGDHGSPLSWFSPLAWSNQTRPYVDARWWPLLLSVGLATAASAAGYTLAGRRDLGAGLVAARTGRPTAAAWLRSPLAVAFRLQRSGLIWWTVALAAFGFIFGGLADQTADPESISENRIDMFGGSVDTLIDGYLGITTLLTAVLACVMVVLGVHAMRSEETSGRAGPMLATATSRSAWFGSYLAVLAIGVTGLLLVVGFVSGVGAALSAGDRSYVWAVIGAHLAHAPAVLLLLGLAAFLLAALPRAIGATWVLVGSSLFVGFFGTLLDLPRWFHNAVPMAHIGRPPLDRVSWSASVTLVAMAAALAVVGLVAFRRRDLDTE